jgi:DNA polymerase-3 subunit gamma/tau
MPAGHIVSHLERILGEEQIAFEQQALRLLARAADGSMRDALSLTDQAIAYSANHVTEEAVRGMLGALDQSYLIRLIDALVGGDGATVLAIADEMALRSLSFSTALQDLASLFHRVAWAQFAPASTLDEWPEAADIRRFADALSPEQVQLFYQIATLGRSELGLAPDEYAGFTMTLLRMLAFEPSIGAGGAGSAPASKQGAVPAGGRSVAASASVSAGGSVVADAGQSRVAAVSPLAQRSPAKAEPLADDVAEKPAPSVSDRADAGSSARESAVAPSAASTAPTDTAVALPTPPWESGDDALPASATSIATAIASSASQQPSANAAEPSPNDSPPTVITTPASSQRATVAASTPASPASRGGRGASAALDVLRSAGMKLSSDRSGRATAAVPTAPKPAPRAAVLVPQPDPARRAAATDISDSAARQPARAAAQRDDAGAMPPWDDIPPDADADNYLPADAYFAPPDDNFVPVFDSEPSSARAAAPASVPAAPAAAIVDVSQLPPGIPLGPIGFEGDWPALAATLSLKGISYQLAFNSELTALDGSTLKLSVPVPQYAEASQVAKLKAALAERLGNTLDVVVEVGPARRTAAALDAAARAERQRDAEREIGSDPFVQQLIRDFGASIVPGSVKPLAQDAAAGSGSAGGATH